MKTITDDTVNYLPIDCLQKLVFAAIDAQADCDNPDNPQRAAQYARDRKLVVLDAMSASANYPADQRSMLLGFWQHFGGGR